MTQDSGSEIPHERQVELRKLAFIIVSQLPRDAQEARFTIQTVENMLHFIDRGEWPARVRGDDRSS